ncbi:MAG: TolC family protein [Alphaproteobacteria bacterium]
MILPLLLTGCMDVLFPYKHVEAPTPAQWREAPGETLKQAWPDAEWWKAFNTPELTALIAQAQANNFDIGAAVARVKQANAEVRINGAALLPELDATAGATHTHSGGGAATTTIGGTTTTIGRSRSGTTYNAALNASYELDFWGKNLSALEAAKASRAASE